MKIKSIKNFIKLAKEQNNDKFILLGEEYIYLRKKVISYTDKIRILKLNNANNVEIDEIKNKINYIENILIKKDMELREELQSIKKPRHVWYRKNNPAKPKGTLVNKKHTNIGQVVFKTSAKQYNEKQTDFNKAMHGPIYKTKYKRGKTII